MNPDLIKHVKFEVSNLVSDPVKNGPYDIIFIRNVMIYFDETLKRKILDKIYDNLKPGGFMVIGYFDAILPVLDRTKFEYYDLKSKIFRKI